ncbi:CocE/NonD family hydrolase [Aquabacterium sp. J223]|uniref:CocE/NonD family hydrolase n=1 Tax=Aquabacterium sp. J223 TaxID=2898431 RepID=UPI0021AD8121|nr:CocE/NonD family hydrolase [Aquabacterium sp. J223]UUX95337.1 CocE/NonD family hydrolase [Aquabacterium sp. J223]
MTEPTRIVRIPMRDGIEIAAALYLPPEAASVSRPTLLAASPYRFDNNAAPARPVFLWRETGPIEWYLAQGYAFVHMDVRGTGRSGGDYRYMCPAEQRDLYEVIEWIARQPWSNGRVGGIGQSYYARMQWFMAIQGPPALKCIAPFDGNVDTYRASAYTGGIPGEFPGQTWYNGTVRTVNQYPAQGPSRLLEWDYALAVRQHPTYDDFWRERAAAESLDRIRVPVLSIGVWRKVDLHLNGNIVGFERSGGPKKLLVFNSSSVQDAVSDFSSVAFHERHLLPFYDRYLKEEVDNGYDRLPPVRYYVTGSPELHTAEQWPPADAAYREFRLSGRPSGSVQSLNDGSLDDGFLDEADAPVEGPASTSYEYPDPGWRIGVVGFDERGRPDPARRVLTFTSPALTAPLHVCGPIKLVLYAASSGTDTDFIVKLSEQAPRDPGELARGVNPASQVVTKGWLRASHRALDPRWSREMAPQYAHDAPSDIVPRQVVRYQIAIMPTGHCFRAGSRLRLEIANGDSMLTENVFAHEYGPRKVGRDTFFHSAEHPSALFIPVRSTSP